MLSKIFSKRQRHLHHVGLFLVAMSLVFSFLSPFFFSIENFINILTASSVIGLMALGATFVIASGGIDLSTSAVMALSGVVAAWCAQNLGLSPLSIVTISCLSGIICGFVTGLLVVLTRAPSFIITLGMLSIARAIAYIISDGLPIYGIDERITELGQGNLFSLSSFSLPWSVLIFMAGVILAAFILTVTCFSQQILVLGDNMTAAIAMGVPVNLLRIKVFTLAGFYSGIAGFVFTARTNSGDPSAGQNYELLAITAVILGGNNLFGGRATIIGTFLGVLCLGVLQNGLNLMAISTFYQILFIGLILIIAAFFRRYGEE